MKKMRLDSLALYLIMYPEKEALTRAFKVLDFQTITLRDLGIETDFVETIIFEDKEYHRKDYFTVPEPADHPSPPTSEP